MPAGTFSRGMAVAGLLVMIAALLLPVPTPWSGTGGWVAAAMVPYFCIALAEVIADPTGRFVAGLLAGGAMVVFFAALDFTRRTGVSLRS